MCLDVFPDLDELVGALSDIGANHIRIDKVHSGYRASVPDHLAGRLKQHYAKRMVLLTVSRMPGHSVKRITEKDGKIHIKIEVK